MRFGIRNKQTKVVMVLNYELETFGPAYMTYERPVFFVEEMTDVTSGMPVWTTDSAEVAQKVIYECYKGQETVAYPKIEKSWGEEGKAEYEVFVIGMEQKGQNNILALSVARLGKAKLYLQKLSPGKPVTVSAVAKEVGFKASAVLEFIENKPGHFETEAVQVGRTKSLAIKNVYDLVRDNPKTQEYLDFKIKINQKSITISYYDNYGFVSGYYIQPSKDKLEIQYMNTPEKVSEISKALSLKQASYTIGGFGDSSTYQPKDAYEISYSQLKQLMDEGWTVIGEFLEKPDSKNMNSDNTYKLNKK
ncbi:hypothetical protein [Bdellovibrio sp. BCCA]|uniref:hypothetical protein n=1 Tax=Bdellovibrio sp. BCCA TaxID=3136281 RepID=UPI0030F2CD62